MTLETLASLVTIMMIPIGWSLPWLGECGKPYGGGYDVKTSIAYVCDNENKQVVQMEKYHEIGHHFYSLLSEKEKSEYSKLYEKDKSKIYNFYREYGRTNVEESFARRRNGDIHRYPTSTITETKNTSHKEIPPKS